MNGEFRAGLFGQASGGPEPTYFTRRPWVSGLLRFAIWSSVLGAVIVGCFVNSVLLRAPIVYNDIHRLDNWTPFASLTPEAQAFAFEVWYRPAAALGHFVPNCWEFYDLREHLLLEWTSSPEVVQELVVSKVIIPTPPQRQVSLEDLMARYRGDHDELKWRLRKMLRKGDLSPARYRASVDWLKKNPEKWADRESGRSRSEI